VSCFGYLLMLYVMLDASEREHLLSDDFGTALDFFGQDINTSCIVNEPPQSRYKETVMCSMQSY